MLRKEALFFIFLGRKPIIPRFFHFDYQIPKKNLFLGDPTSLGLRKPNRMDKGGDSMSDITEILSDILNGSVNDNDTVNDNNVAINVSDLL